MTVERIVQRLIVGAVRPYVRAELPMWGAVCAATFAYERDSLWRNAPKLRGRNKYFGYESQYDLSKWADRSTYFLGRWHDLPAQLVLAAAKPKVVVDIGANRGEFTLAAAHLAKRVISFEPNPDMVHILRSDLSINAVRNVTLHEIGLSDKSSTLTLCVPDVNSGSASFGGFQSEGRQISGIPVEVGDEVLAGEKPDLIKIDVEGFETKVVLGLLKTLRHSRPIIIMEVLDENLRRCGSSVDELSRLMTSLGYSSKGIGTKRRGVVSHLALGVESADVAWLPDDRKLEASTRDLYRAARPYPAGGPKGLLSLACTPFVTLVPSLAMVA